MHGLRLLTDLLHCPSARVVARSQRAQQLHTQLVPSLRTRAAQQGAQLGIAHGAVRLAAARAIKERHAVAVAQSCSSARGRN